MKISLLYDLRNPPQAQWHMPWPDYYAAALEHMEEMERLGFHAITFAEHHGDPDGYNPGMPVMLTAAAGRTKTVRIGANIIQLPLYNPVLLAEQLALIDILSDGRLDVGVGTGVPTFVAEYSMLGVNPRFKPSLLEEGLDILQRCWTEDEPFDYHGKRWDLRDVVIKPKPVQSPIPLWVAAPFAEKPMERVARLGLGVGAAGGMFFNLTGDDDWANWLAGWKQVCERHGRALDTSIIRTVGTCFVSEDPERDWRKHQDAFFYAFNYERNNTQPYVSIMPPLTPENIPSNHRVFQTPEQTIAELRRSYSEEAPGELYVTATKPGMTFEESAEHMRLFAKYVLPVVKDL
jgi:alkanesulfonate monooxygenase SsuD/methylene tetrahydromethanopterin reductase-like flavin-dependent oxidoreductase (luciferase family)